jgi:hypothetical protein
MSPISDDWSDRLGQCDHCGKENVPILNASDPFMNEIHPDDEPRYSDWCEDCFTDRARDI